MYALAAVLIFLGGAVTGAATLSIGYGWMMSRPENARRILESAWKVAHSHWLQVSKDDATPVCPCCGWREKKAA